MPKYIMEFLGTFFLVLTIGLCVIAPGAGELAPLAIGGMLVVLVYMGGPTSGAHYNPAVTLAVWMRGKCDTKDVPGYLIAQIAGALLAATIVKTFKADSVIVAGQLNTQLALLAEFLFTFALAFVILNVATSKKSEGNSYYGIAIGFTVMAGAYTVGNVSGGVFNPAVAIGTTVMGLNELSNIWIFMVANFTGGAVAAIVYKITNPDEV